MSLNTLRAVGLRLGRKVVVSIVGLLLGDAKGLLLLGAVKGLTLGAVVVEDVAGRGGGVAEAEGLALGRKVGVSIVGLLLGDVEGLALGAVVDEDVAGA